MILHIFTQVSEYSREFTRLLNEEFNPQNHVIVYRSRPDKGKSTVAGKIRIHFVESRNELITIMPQLLFDSEKIIFHSFPVSRSLLFWYSHRKSMRKAVWSVWGQDAYWYKYCKKNLSNILYEHMRGRLIRNLHAILCPIQGDYDYIKSHYHTRALYISGMYPIPTDFESLKALRTSKNSDGQINFQLGNSATPTNNLEQLIFFFSKFSDRNKFRFYCPLSYGDKTYAERIADLGKKELGDSFVPLLSLLNRDEYAQFIASVDVLIMNHQRQQGLGNILSYLYLGKKVYIRSDNSSFPFFESNGIKVYNTLELLNTGELSDLAHIPGDIAESNMLQTEKLVSKKEIASGWRKIFN